MKLDVLPKRPNVRAPFRDFPWPYDKRNDQYLCLLISYSDTVRGFFYFFFVFFIFYLVSSPPSSSNQYSIETTIDSQGETTRSLLSAN